MAGGWASALGAAILGGNQGYQDAKLNQQRALMSAIQVKLAQDQLNELPKKHAEADVDRQFARDGIASFGDPNYLKNSAIAGQPIQTKDIVAKQLQQVEGPPRNIGQATPSNLTGSSLVRGDTIDPFGPEGPHSQEAPVLSRVQTAANMGVDPNTGAVIPPHLLLQAKKDQQGLAQSDFITQFLRSQMGGDQTPSAPGVSSARPDPFAGAPPPPSPLLPGMDDPTFPNGVKQYLTTTKQKYGDDNAAALEELNRARPDLLAAHPNLDWAKVTSSFPVQAASATATAPDPNAGMGPEPPYEDPKAKADRILGKLSGLDTGDTKQESVKHEVFKKTAEAEALAHFKTTAAVQKEADAYRKASVLIQELRPLLMQQVHDPNDPHGQHLNPIVGAALLARQKAKYAAYKAHYPTSDVDAKVAQLGGLLKVIGAAPYMAGSRSMVMFNNAADHLTDGSGLAESNLQKIDEIEPMFKEFGQLIGLRPVNAGRAAPSAQAPAASPAPAAAPAAPALPPRLPPGTSVPESQIQANLAPGETLLGEIAKLKSSGINVIKGK